MISDFTIARNHARPGSSELRCTNCGALLARIVGSGIEIKRGGCETVFVGVGFALVRCYGRDCGTMNTFAVSTQPPANVSSMR
jgi:hypothetical protein